MSPSLWLIFHFLWCFLIKVFQCSQISSFFLLWFALFVFLSQRHKDILLYCLLKVLNVGFWNNFSLIGIEGGICVWIVCPCRKPVVPGSFIEELILALLELHLPWHLLCYIKCPYMCESASRLSQIWLPGIFFKPWVNTTQPWLL